MCLKSPATAKRTLMNGLSVSAQSPLQPSPMMSASGQDEKSLSVTALTGSAGNETEGSMTPASTSEQSSNGSQKPLMKYWIRETPDNKRGFTMTTVYRVNPSKKTNIERCNDRPFAEWWGCHDSEVYGLFSAELEPGLTVGDAARLLRMKREGAKS